MTLYIPLWTKSGVQSNVAEPSPLSVNEAPEGNVDAEKAGMVESASLADSPKLNRTPSVVDWAPIADMTGVWLPASVTVIVTISESVRAPSKA